MFLSVVIPTYNEEKVISSTIQQVLNYLRQQSYQWELIIADDCSSDKTVEIAMQFAAKIVVNQKNLGKGGAICNGFRAAQGQWLLFLDADYSTTMEELDRFWPHTHDYDIVIASRAVAGAQISQKQPWYKIALGRLGNVIIQLFLLPGIKDTQCGFKLYRREIINIFEQLKNLRWSFDFEVLFLAKKNNYQILELPVSWTNNRDTTVKPIDYLFTLLDVIKIRYHYYCQHYQKNTLK